MRRIREGDRVKVHYHVYDLAGRLLAHTDGRAISIVAGGNDSVCGLSQGVLGMQVGEKKALQLSPMETFGAGNTAALRTISNSRIQGEPQVGDCLRLTRGEQSFDLWVLELREREVLVSSQHPLAGNRMDLHLEIVSLD